VVIVRAMAAISPSSIEVHLNIGRRGAACSPSAL
jgi:hypothetical protein